MHTSHTTYVQASHHICGAHAAHKAVIHNIGYMLHINTMCMHTCKPCMCTRWADIIWTHAVQLYWCTQTETYHVVHTQMAHTAYTHEPHVHKYHMKTMYACHTQAHINTTHTTCECTIPNTPQNYTQSPKYIIHLQTTDTWNLPIRTNHT